MTQGTRHETRDETHRRRRPGGRRGRRRSTGWRRGGGGRRPPPRCRRGGGRPGPGSVYMCVVGVFVVVLVLVGLGRSGPGSTLVGAAKAFAHTQDARTCHQASSSPPRSTRTAASNTSRCGMCANVRWEGISRSVDRSRALRHFFPPFVRRRFKQTNRTRKASIHPQTDLAPAPLADCHRRR